jgi:hypothetical protein
MQIPRTERSSENKVVKRECRNAPEIVLQVGIHARGTWMFTGTLIDELISTVERAETSFRLDPEQESKLEYWYTVAQNELANLGTYELAGVA